MQTAAHEENADWSVVITGAAGGIGSALVRRFLTRGARVDAAVRYGGHDMEAFEAQMRQRAPVWSAFDIRMMMQGYLERGFTAEAGDLETLTALIGHPPRRYEDFAHETVAKWAKGLPWPLDKIAEKLRRVLASPTREFDMPTIPPAPSGFASHAASVNGVRLHYWLGGEPGGPPVLNIPNDNLAPSIP